jgi:hypothetical protein
MILLFNNLNKIVQVFYSVLIILLLLFVNNHHMVNFYMLIHIILILINMLKLHHIINQLDHTSKNMHMDQLLVYFLTNKE